MLAGGVHDDFIYLPGAEKFMRKDQGCSLTRVLGVMLS